MHVLPGGEGVDGPAALLGKEPCLKSRAEDGTARRSSLVLLSAPEHDDGANAEHDGRERVRQPEADMLLTVNFWGVSIKSYTLEVEPLNTYPLIKVSMMYM